MRFIKQILVLISLLFLLLAGCIEPTEQTEAKEANSIISLNDAMAIAKLSECTENSNLTGDYIYNENTRTWWLDIDLEKEGCNPACVVDENTKTAEINWRCTGLLQ